MEYINLTITQLGEGTFRRSTLADRGVWLTLLAYCVQQENGGVIPDARQWGDWDCLQVLGIPRAELDGDHRLWKFNANDLHVEFYPLAKQKEVQAKRRAGRRGGISSGEARSEHTSSSVDSSASSSASSTARTEGNRKGKEEKEKGTEGAAARVYALYPKHVGRKAAVRAILRAIAEHGEAKIVEATTAFGAAVAGWPESERRFVPHPATWFAQGRFDDDRRTWQKSSSEKGAAAAPFNPTGPNAHTGGLQVFEPEAGGEAAAGGAQ